MDDMKSTGRFVFNFESGIGAWNSKKPEGKVLSSWEAEYISISSAT